MTGMNSVRAGTQAIACVAQAVPSYPSLSHLIPLAYFPPPLLARTLPFSYPVLSLIDLPLDLHESQDQQKGYLHNKNSR